MLVVKSRSLGELLCDAFSAGGTGGGVTGDSVGGGGATSNGSSTRGLVPGIEASIPVVSSISNQTAAIHRSTTLIVYGQIVKVYVCVCMYVSLCNTTTNTAHVAHTRYHFSFMHVPAKFQLQVNEEYTEDLRSEYQLRVTRQSSVLDLRPINICISH